MNPFRSAPNWFRTAAPPVRPFRWSNAWTRCQVHDGGVFAVVDFVLVTDLADVGDVGEQLVQARPGEQLFAALFNRRVD